MREWLEGQWQDRKIGLIALRRRSASLLDIFRGLLFCLLVCLFLLWKKRKHSVMVSFWVRPVRSLTGRNKKKTIVGNYSAARKLESRKCPLYFGRFLGRRSSFSVFFFFFLRVVRSRHYAAPLAKTEISRRSRRFPNSDEREKGLFVCVFLNKRIISKTNFIFFFCSGWAECRGTPHGARWQRGAAFATLAAGGPRVRIRTSRARYKRKKTWIFFSKRGGIKKKSKKKNGPVSCAVAGVRPRRSTNQRSA